MALCRYLREVNVPSFCYYHDQLLKNQSFLPLFVVKPLWWEAKKNRTKRDVNTCIHQRASWVDITLPFSAIFLILEPIVYKTRVKICGITSVSDAQHASDCGADAIGLVFYSRSPRALASLDIARDISLSVGAFVNVVALFVNPDANYVNDVLATVPVSLLQFHGDESESFCRQFSRPYIKALRMKEGLNIADEIEKYRGASGVLLDAFVEGVPGGTGKQFDWDRVPKAQHTHHVILAGGLNPLNVGDALRQVSPYAVDVSGGVEIRPGVKDPKKVAAFIQNTK